MKHLFFLLLLTLISCKDHTSTYTVTEKNASITPENSTMLSNHNDLSPKEAIHYVNTTSNLNYRDAPQGNVLGKFTRNERVTLVKHSGFFSEIEDEGEIINGEWVGVLSGRDTVYVFDAFLSSTPIVSEVWSKFPIRKMPFKDTTGFGDIDTSQPLSSTEIDELQLLELYPNIHTDHCKVYPSYQLDKEGYKSIVVNVLKNEHELEAVLINYDDDNTLRKFYRGEDEEPSINAVVVAYDEIAEGWSSITSQFKNNCITIVDALYTDIPVIDTTLYHINRFGDINLVNTDFANDIRPNQPIEIGTVYTDTIQFLNYNDEGDYFFMEGKKNSKNIFLYYRWDYDSKNRDFQKNDIIEVQWEIDSLYVAGDGETLFFAEMAIDARKVK